MKILDEDELALRVSQHVKMGSTPNQFITDCTGEAVDLLTLHIGTAPVPQRVYERAVVEVAADLYYRRNAVNGIATFDNGEAVDALRIGNDPLKPVRAMLKPYLGLPIA